MSGDTDSTGNEIRGQELSDSVEIPAQAIFTTPSIFEVTTAVTINRADFDTLVSSGQSYPFSWVCIGITLAWIITMLSAYFQNGMTETWHWKIFAGTIASLYLASQFEEPIASWLARRCQTKRYKVLTEYDAKFKNANTRIMARSDDMPDEEK